MITIPFNVNDNNLRKIFLDQLLLDSIQGIDENREPLWGKMTPHNMIEHLLWAFECSTGILEVPCRTPVNVLERAKRFLYDDRPTPRGFKNPLLGEDPLPVRFTLISQAKNIFQQEVAHCIRYYNERPGAIHVHPVFGPLGAEEWQRSHFKHCYHHLLQFGIIHSNDDISL
jgi:oxepin-CoA hydrolase / 3-oxo-5,6-dehydrosuberyl-CoA semialdehyde dehydrogenase